MDFLYVQFPIGLQPRICDFLCTILIIFGLSEHNPIKTQLFALFEGMLDYLYTPIINTLGQKSTLQVHTI